MADLITAEQCRELLSYDPATGEMRWLAKASRSTRVGSIAGVARPDGRWVIRVRKKLYLRYRLAFLIMEGRWPPAEVDHIDGDGANDAWANLRHATRSENARNIGARRDNKTGLKGVSPHPCGKFQSHIQHNGVAINLGLFHAPEAAHAAYCQAASQLQGEYIHPSIKEKANGAADKLQP